MRPPPRPPLDIAFATYLLIGWLAAGTAGCDDDPVESPTVGDVDNRVESLGRQVEQFRADTRVQIREHTPDTGIPSSGPSPSEEPDPEGPDSDEPSNQ